MLFLALWGPDRAPSQRYRVEHFLDFWRSRGVETEYAWILDNSEMPAFYGHRLGPKVATGVKAALRRARSLVPLLTRSAYDLVLVQRQAFFVGRPWSEWIAARRVPVLFDFDDAIWLPDVSEGNRRLARFKNVEKIPAIVRLASTVVAGNTYLADWAKSYNTNTVIVPTCVDTDRYVPGQSHRASESPIVVGWSGNPSTMRHFVLILPVLERLRRKYGDAVRFKVVGDPAFRHEQLGIIGEAWSSATEVQALQSMDIGIMPMPNDEWSKGKCGLKALTYMSAGVPTVCSLVGVNSEIVDDGKNGYIARSDDDWVNQLSQLIEDEALRTRLGAAGRQSVIDRYSVKRWQEPMLRIIEQTAERKAVG